MTNSTRRELTPCMICEKAVIYLWNETNKFKGENLNGAAWTHIYPGYGSNFDLHRYIAVICDDCIDAAIQSKRISFLERMEE
jgi:hypothetical protein